MKHRGRDPERHAQGRSSEGGEVAATKPRYTEDEILAALDRDTADVARESAEGASDPDDDDVYWPWSREAALLIRQHQAELDELRTGRMLVFDLLETLRPEIAANCLIRHMRGEDADMARAARAMAQYFRETHDGIGALLDRPAEAYDMRMREAR